MAEILLLANYKIQARNQNCSFRIGNLLLIDHCVELMILMIHTAIVVLIIEKIFYSPSPKNVAKCCRLSSKPEIYGITLPYLTQCKITEKQLGSVLHRIFLFNASIRALTRL